jgi:DNA-binding beta-propeller fold protein YncE
MEIACTAPDHVRAVIDSMGRTEDVRFSPNNRRLAVAAFNNHRIVLFDVGIDASAGKKRVALTGVAEFSSPSLNYPHGIDFIDDETLVVASRFADVAIFKLPPVGAPAHIHELTPIEQFGAGEASLLKSPGSVSVIRRDGAQAELLVCNNSGHSVTRHVVDRGADCAIGRGEILLQKGLNLPDGVSTSRDGRWIAVSNHNTHGVLLYRSAPSLNADSLPDGVLRCVYYPHGLRFTADGRHILVADAGAPYIHIYASDGQGWCGARNPVASFRIMDDAVFARGRNNPQEGGPKGIDIDRGMNVLVATSEHQPLVFFGLPAILESLPSEPEVLDVRYELAILEQADRFRARLHQAEDRAARAEARLAAAKKRKLRKIKAALRRAFSAFRRRNRLFPRLSIKAGLTISRDNS